MGCADSIFSEHISKWLIPFKGPKKSYTSACNQKRNTVIFFVVAEIYIDSLVMDVCQEFLVLGSHIHFCQGN